MPFCPKCMTELDREWFRWMRNGRRYRRCRLCEAKDRLKAAGDAHTDLKRRREQEQHEARLRREHRNANQARQASGFSEWDRRTRIAAGDRPGEEDRSS